MEGAWAAVVRNATGKQQREGIGTFGGYGKWWRQKWGCKECSPEEGLQHVRGRGAV